MIRFDKKKQEIKLAFLFILTLVVHIFRFLKLLYIDRLHLNIVVSPLIFIAINIILFLTLITLSKKNHYRYLNHYILLLNIFIAIIEPFEVCFIHAGLYDLIKGFSSNRFTILYGLVEHMSYILSLKGFYILYILLAYHHNNTTIRKTQCLILFQFFPLIDLLLITRELFYNEMVNKKLVILSVFVSVLFFVSILSGLLYVGYLVSSF